MQEQIREGSIRINNISEDIRISPKKSSDESVHASSDKKKSRISDQMMETDTINKLFWPWVLEWSENDYFQKFIAKKIKKQLNKNRPSFFDEFTVPSFSISQDPLKLKQIQVQRSEPFEFLADLDLQYDGLIEFEIDTTMNISLTVKEYKIKIRLLVQLLTVYGVVRLWFVPRKFGKSWMSFITEPLLNIKIDPIIGDDNYHVTDLPHIQTMIRNLIIEKFKKMIYPNRTSIDVP